MDHLHHTKNPLYLFLGCTGVFILAAYVNIFPPDQLVYVGTFFILLLLTLTLLILYVGRDIRRSIVISGGIVLYLLLRYFGLRHPLYLILLIAATFAVDYISRVHPK